MIFITTLGTPGLYLLVIPVLYWCVSRRWGHEFGLSFLFSMWLNGFLKDLIALPRPTAAQGVRIVVHEWSNGFPSGHTQGAVGFWGYLGVRIRIRWFRALCGLFIVLIALSRLYLGAHYLSDVVAGLLIGIAVLSFFLLGYARSWVKRWPNWLKGTLAVVVPVVLMVLDTNPNSYIEVGILMGLLLTDLFALEGVVYEERASWGKQVGKLVVGFTVLTALALILTRWVPEGLPEMLGFSLVGGWVTLGAPLVFQKLGLAPRPECTVPSRRLPRRFALTGSIMVILLCAVSLAGMAAPRLPGFSVATPAFARADSEAAEVAADTSSTNGLVVRHHAPNGQPFVVLGHKGSAATAPEETMPSFVAASQMGVDLLDLDVRMTKDHHLIALHNDTVDATTNGHGPIGSMTLAEVKQLDAGYWMTTDGGKTYPFRGQGITLLTLDELLAAFPDKQFNIEMKDHAAIAGELAAEVVKNAHAEQRVIVGSFWDAPLDAFRQQMPQVRTMLSQSEILRAFVLQHLGLGEYYVPPARYAEIPETRGAIRVITPGFIRYMHARGVIIYVWTVNEQKDMERLMNMGVDGIISDDPGTLLHVALANPS